MSFLSAAHHAFSFLTRLPLPQWKWLRNDPESLLRSVIWYPLVGALYGGLALVIAMPAMALGVDTRVLAVVLLAAPLVMNRFLHFDGLCDCADAFLADKAPEDRLAIMKDSRIGSFALGVGALVLLGRYGIVQGVLEQGRQACIAFFLVPVVARWTMGPLAWKAAYPRAKGTGGFLVGKVGPGILAGSTVVLCLVACTALALAGSPFLVAAVLFFLGALGISLMVAVLLRLWSNSKIGGITGDVLGASQELIELALLAWAWILFSARPAL